MTMMRLRGTVAAAVMLVIGVGIATAADMKPIHTQKTKDVVVALMSGTGQWKEGKN